MTMIGSVEAGCYRLRDVETGAEEWVDLVEVGRSLQRQGEYLPEETFQLLPYLGTEQVAGLWSKVKKVGRKVGRAVKKGAKKVVKVAKKVAKTRIVKNAWNSAKNMPAPYGTYFQAADTAFKFGKSLVPPKKTRKRIKAGIRKARTVVKKPSRTKVLNHKRARAALPLVRALAGRKTTVAKATRAAKKIGIKPKTVINTALAMRLASPSAPPKARKAIATARKINALTATKQTTRTITAPSGRKYEISVKAA